MIIKRLKNQKGSYAIISVILVFIIVTAISAYTDMISKRWTINEVQSIMDASGTNTLKSQIDLNKLYSEKFGTANGGYFDINNSDEKGEKLNKIIDKKFKDEVKNAYLNEINSQVGNNASIKDLDVQQVEISFDYDSFGLGKSQTPRPQFTLDSVTKLRVKSSTLLDGMEGVSKDIYSSRNNSSFRVEYKGVKEDGYSELIVRSVTRLVYR